MAQPTWKNWAILMGLVWLEEQDNEAEHEDGDGDPDDGDDDDSLHDDADW